LPNNSESETPNKLEYQLYFFKRRW